MEDYYVPLSSRDVERVKIELNVSDQAKFEHTLRLFEEWVSYQTYLPQNYDRTLLRTFLRQCKHDLEKAKTKFRSYMVNMHKVPQLFQNRMSVLDPDKNIFRYMYLFPLPLPTPDSCRIIFTKMINPDPTVIDLHRIMQTITMFADFRMHIDEVSAGDIFITDAELLHGGHMPILLNTTMKKCLDMGLESYPIRIKAIHIIADAPIVVHGVNIFKAFLREDLRKKFHMHKDMQSVTQFVPLKCIPADYGGGQKSLSELSAEVMEMLKNGKSIFEAVEGLRLRGPVPKDCDTNTTLEFGGVQGSFRKLSVD